MLVFFDPVSNFRCHFADTAESSITLSGFTYLPLTSDPVTGGELADDTPSLFRRFLPVMTNQHKIGSTTIFSVLG